MLVVMKPQAAAEEIQAVCEHIQLLGFRAHPIPGAQRTAIGITGNSGAMDQGDLEEISGVVEVIRVSKPYKLVSRDIKHEDTVITFPRHQCDHWRPGAGDHRRTLLDRVPGTGFRNSGAGRSRRSPVLSRRRLQTRTSPYAFQGMGEDGLKIMAEIRETFGMRIVTEAWITRAWIWSRITPM